LHHRPLIPGGPTELNEPPAPGEAEGRAPILLAHSGRAVAPALTALVASARPVLREQGARTGHIVVVYYGGEGGAITIDAGVEACTDPVNTNAYWSASQFMADASHYGTAIAYGSA
jgi:hypothetical protein